MSKKYKLIVLVGRWEPCHIGHIRNISYASTLADNVHIIVGSSFQPRTIKNPFTANERISMLNNVIESLEVKDINWKISPIKDQYSNNLWIKSIQDIIKKDHPLINDNEIAILGYEKDHTSWYLRAFPSWKFVEIDKFVEIGSQTIDATKIRELLFEGHINFISGAVSPSVFKYLTEFIKTTEYKTLVEEYNYIKEYKKTWAVAPYPPIFFTVDAVVIQGGHVLLVKRKFAPGKGLWALPGGFINQHETAKDACIRELKEETKLKIPVPVLQGSITYEQLFDKPDRSLRGRTLTQAFLIELNGGDGSLPMIKASDDAEFAKWVPISDIEYMSDQLFEDHYHIIQLMVSRAK